MRLLVTGASGLLGANLCYLAAGMKNDVLAAYNEHKVSIPGCTQEKLDILSSDLSGIRRFSPDCVVHCAAYTNVDGCETDREKARKLNVDATARLVSECRVSGVRLIFISTDSVFDGKTPFHKESEPVRPMNFYSQSKVEAERIVSGLDNHAIVRTNFYGFNYQQKQSFSEWLHAKFSAGEPFNAFTDFYFSPILANNLCVALLELAESDFRGLMHVAGDGRISKFDFARHYAEVFGFDKSLALPKKMADVHELKAKRPHDCSLDISMAKSALRTKLLKPEEGIARYKGLYDSGYQQKLRGE